MSSPNPLVPQGSLLEQQAKSKSTFHVATLIVGLHVFLFGGLLILGCKREGATGTGQPPITDTLSSPPPVVTETNVPLTDPYAAGLAGNAVPGGALTSAPPVTIEPPITQPLIPPVQPEPQTPAGSEYVIKKGDIAYNLAKKNGLTLKQLQEANPGVDLGKLKVNQKLTIPGATVASHSAPSVTDTAVGDGVTYLVKGGDNLTKISKKFGVTIKAIRDANNLKSNDIKIGQKLRIPAKAAAAVPEPAPVTPLQPTTIQIPTATPVNPTPQ
jgi:LysM repeat protein